MQGKKKKNIIGTSDDIVCTTTGWQAAYENRGHLLGLIRYFGILVPSVPDSKTFPPVKK